jgi:hypothetical protein
MVHDSDLRFSPVVDMIYGDTPRCNEHRPPPLQYPNTALVLKNENLIRKKTFLFGWGAQGQLDSFLLEKGTLDK